MYFQPVLTDIRVGDLAGELDVLQDDSCQILTYDKEHFHYDVADDGGARSCDSVVVGREADVVGHSDSHVEGSQQDEPVPQGLRHTVVQQNEAWLLHCCHLVLWYWRLVHHVLLEKRGHGWSAA